MQKKKASWLRYIMPYVIILGIIVLISFIYNSSTTSKRSSYNGGDIIPSTFDKVELNAQDSILWTDNVKQLEITVYNNFIDVEGSYV